MTPEQAQEKFDGLTRDYFSLIDQLPEGNRREIEQKARPIIAAIADGLNILASDEKEQGQHEKAQKRLKSAQSDLNRFTDELQKELHAKKASGEHPLLGKKAQDIVGEKAGEVEERMKLQTQLAALQMLVNIFNEMCNILKSVGR